MIRWFVRTCSAPAFYIYKMPARTCIGVLMIGVGGGGRRRPAAPRRRGRRGAAATRDTMLLLRWLPQGQAWQMVGVAALLLVLLPAAVSNHGGAPPTIGAAELLVLLAKNCPGQFYTNAQ